MPAQTSSIQNQQVNLQNTSTKDIKTSSNNQLNANSGGSNHDLYLQIKTFFKINIFPFKKLKPHWSNQST